MSGFKRVFRQFPGFETLLEIESVNIIDVVPPSQIIGAGSGVVLLVGEFERGPFVPTPVYGPSDLITTFGGLGHATENSPHDGATARKSGGDELWNGNGFCWLRNKRFRGLVIQRVDNSAGVVRFTRLATLIGGAGPYTGVSPGGTVQFTRNGVTVVTATITANAGQITGTGGVYPTTFVGGETLEVRVDNDAPRIITFTAAEQTLNQVVDRINAVLAQTVASNQAGQLRLSSVIRGRSGRIEVVGGTARTQLGLPTAATQQVSTVTIVSNAVAGAFTLSVTRYVAGVLTAYLRTYTSTGGQTTAQVRDGLLAAINANPIPGITALTGGGSTLTLTGDANVLFTPTVSAEPAVGQMTIAPTTPGVVVVDEGDGNVANVDSIERADAIEIFGALAGLDADETSESLLRVTNSGTPGTGTLQVTGGTAYAAFGFDLTTVSSAASGEDVTIPAGTRVQDSTATGTIWVTIEDVDTGATGGPFEARVRPWEDTDSALASTAGNVTLILDTLPDGFSVTNAAGLTRLSAAQIDARYLAALDVTLDQSSEAYDANIVAAARSSEAIMRYLKANALAATRDGMAARKAVVRPPLGTSRTDMRASTGVGVGNTQLGRDERVNYIGFGFTTQIPEIAEVGSRGGTGFTDDGVIQQGGDSYYCMVRSILNPEENAGQPLGDTDVVSLPALALEDAYNPKKGGVALQLEDYKAFKRSGIIAPVIDRNEGPMFASDVTSVDPTLELVKADANRRYMADFVIDTLAKIGMKYLKKLQSPTRQRALKQDVSGFLKLLKSENQPQFARIEGYFVLDETTADQRALGLAVILVKVKMLSVYKSLAFRAEVGTSVQIDEVAA